MTNRRRAAADTGDMRTESETIAELGVLAAGQAVILTTAKGREILVLPNGENRDVSEPNAVTPILPGHIRQSVTVQTADSLVDYVNRFATETTLLFADIDQDLIVGSLDYHAPAEAGHAGHRASLKLPRSMEWACWAAMDGKLVEQLEFARFLQENAADIAAPAAADIMEACRDLHAVRKVNFTKAVRTQTDNENFEYVDETTATTRGGLELPTEFKLAIPVYFGGRYTELKAFLRWRLDDGKLLLGVKLHRPEHVRQAMFKEVVDDVAARTTRLAVFGKLA